MQQWATIQLHAAISRLSRQDAPGSTLLPGSFHPIISPSDWWGNEVILFSSLAGTDGENYFYGFLL